jgi:Zn-dependent protease with chaperone function
VVLTGISSRAFEHPADRSALVALRKVPGFDQALQAMSGVLQERSWRLMMLATGVRVGERQFPWVHQLALDCGQVLDLPSAPEIFIVQDPTVRAMTVGMKRPIVIITSGALDLFEPEELRVVIGHEFGHVMSGHAVYSTMLVLLIRLSTRMVWLPIGYLGMQIIVNALEEWYRKAELSCDRAGLLASQDPTAALRALMKTAGGRDLGELDVTAFLEQAREYEGGGDVRDSVLKLMSFQGQTHPFSVTRAAALQKWVDSGDYVKILEGTYARRADDSSASLKDEAAAAARSYGKSFAESDDPLIRLIRETGASAASATAQRYRRRFADSAGQSEPADADAAPDDSEQE